MNILRFGVFVHKATVTPKFTSKANLSHFRSMSTNNTKFKFAGIQLLVGSDKQKNLDNARAKIEEAAKNGANIVSLPECFNCPYSNDSFPPYSESVPDGPSYQMLSESARNNKIYLIGGSIPEKDQNNKLFNTSLIFGPDGSLLGKHRKMHLFDIDIPGRMTFQESKTLSPGNSLTVINTEYCKIGIGICYDIRFSELAQLYWKEGCKMLIYPGAFNMVTGPAHWELLQRGRALDNQLYVATVSPARNPESTYQAWGHSTVVSPWGEVITTCEHDPTIIYADIDLNRVDEVRAQIPISKQKRNDIYEVKKM